MSVLYFIRFSLVRFIRERLLVVVELSPNSLFYGFPWRSCFQLVPQTEYSSQNISIMQYTITPENGKLIQWSNNLVLDRKILWVWAYNFGTIKCFRVFLQAMQSTAPFARKNKKYFYESLFTLQRATKHFSIL